MISKKIGFVTYREDPNITESDAFLRKELLNCGYIVEGIPWDIPHPHIKEYGSLVIRSTWNYHLKYTQFLEWLNEIQHLGIELWNAYPTLMWNMNKRYLLELERTGITTVPSTLLTRGNITSLESIFKEMGYEDLVIKPTIGASSSGVLHIEKSSISAKQKQFQTLITNQDVLIQPLMKEVFNGEISLIFFGKQYSYAVKKVPKKNEFRVNHGGVAKLYKPDQSVIDQAEHILNSVPEQVLYARVDGIMVNSTFVLMELELVEPHLFLDLYPQGAKLFAETFQSLLQNS